MAAERTVLMCFESLVSLVWCRRDGVTRGPSPTGLQKPLENRHRHHRAGPSHGHSVAHRASDQAANWITIWQTLGL